ncbi:MAG: hypothetical protein HDS31_03445 [Bacteroides sp.]|nr:hypothetical protein [Bacteroides sp.]
MNEIQCPHCHSRHVSKTTTGKVSNGAKEIGGVAIAVGGKIAEEYIGIPFVGKATSAVGKWALSYTPIEYVCGTCDSLFTTTFDSDGVIREICLRKQPMPEEIIQSVKAEYIQATKKRRPYISTVIFALLTLNFVFYLVMGIVEGSILRILGSILFAIPFVIPTIFKWKKIVSLNREIEKCETQSLRDFKKSHRSLFSQYSRYN